LRSLARTALASLSLSPLALFSSQLGAQEGGIVWIAPAECPSNGDVARRVAERIPRDAKVFATTRVERSGDGYRATVSIESATNARGERVLSDPSCDALASSVAIVIAMSVTSHVTEGEGALKPRPPEPPPSGQSGQGASTAEGSHVTLRAEGLVDVGWLPAAGLGGGVAVGVDVLSHLHVELHVALFGNQDGLLDAGRGARFGLVSGGARACWALTNGTIQIAPCVGIGAFRMSAAGFGATKVFEENVVTWGPDAMLVLRARIAGPLAFRTGVGAVAPMSRQSFIISATGTVHEPAPVVFRGFFGPEVTF
jgi:hypothetical protein